VGACRTAPNGTRCSGASAGPRKSGECGGAGGCHSGLAGDSAMRSGGAGLVKRAGRRTRGRHHAARCKNSSPPQERRSQTGNRLLGILAGRLAAIEPPPKSQCESHQRKAKSNPTSSDRHPSLLGTIPPVGCSTAVSAGDASSINWCLRVEYARVDDESETFRAPTRSWILDRAAPVHRRKVQRLPRARVSPLTV